VIESATATAHINFKLAHQVFFGSALDSILKAGERYGDVPMGRNSA
jgi:hypothetical protein